MNEVDGVGDGRVIPGEPTSHRRSGPAAVRMPPRDKGLATFGQVLRDDPREVVAVALGALLGLVWGFHTVAHGDSPFVRTLGAVAVPAALLLLVSYALRFRRPALEDDRWFRSRARRTVRLMLVYAWGVYFTAALVAAMAVFAWRWLR